MSSSSPPARGTGIDQAIESLRALSIDTATGDGTHRYGVEGQVPGLAARPTSVGAVSAIMDVAEENELTVVPLGGMTRTSLGNSLRSFDLAVDMTGLNQVVSHNPADLTATVQAGIPVARLQDTLAGHGQFLAIDPPLPDRATIGGSLAVGWSGPMTWQYWSPRDVTIGMKVVQADGTVTKSGGQVVKNVSGYDMARMHIGAIGTLGIIVEVSLKLTPLPSQQSTALVEFDSDRDCLNAALAVFQSSLVPLAITTLHTRAAQTPFHWDTAKGPLLAVRIGGRAKAVQRQIDDVVALCHGHNSSNIDVLDESSAASMWRGFSDVGWDSQPIPLVGIRASLLPSDVRGAVDQIRAVPSGLRLEPTATTQTAQGTVEIGWYAGEGESSVEQVQAAIAHTLRAVREHGGTAVVEQAPAEAKATMDVWGEPGPAIDVMRSLKRQYDPNGLLSPGRFVGGI